MPFGLFLNLNVISTGSTFLLKCFVLTCAVRTEIFEFAELTFKPHCVNFIDFTSSKIPTSLVDCKVVYKAVYFFKE